MRCGQDVSASYQRKIEMLSEMDDWMSHLGALIDRLKLTPVDHHRVEVQALDRLTRLFEAAASGERSSLDEGVAQLKRFWLHAVPWCSTLSGELEKILIQYEDDTATSD